MHVRPDGETIATGSADKDVKFWSLEHKDATSESVSVLLNHSRKFCFDPFIVTKWKGSQPGSCSYLEDV